MADLRDEIVEDIEVALVELRAVAQPHELASLRELRLDAKDAESQDQLEKIAKQVKSLLAFCRSRAMTNQAIPAVSPLGRRRV
jgi:hypothetical protein